MKEIIKALPKTELHLHLDGSLRPETVLDLAKKEGIKLPATNNRELQQYLKVSDDCNSLNEYLTKFELPQKVMQNERALTRIAYELAEDAVQDNVRYVEVRFAPLLLTDNLTKEQVIESILAGLDKAENDYKIQANLILCCMRNHTPAENVKVAQLAVDYLDRGVVGLDLAGDEANFPPEDHKEAFQLAKEAGLHRTVHAGEAAGADSVRKAINFLDAERIGHGVRSKEDLSILNLLKDEIISLEICPTSNLQTGIVSNIKEHPVAEYYDLGIPVTINTDNRTVSDLTLSKEYLNLYNNFFFDLADIKELILNGVRAAFISKDEKERLIDEFKAEFAKITK
ncbi:adenosine deaminase [Halanaerocella petrolearia]